jgi:hypothetical protein
VRLIATGARIPGRQFTRLADDDIAFIDRSTLEFAALFLPKNTRTDPPLILPVSFRTMGGRRGRSALIGVEGAAPEQIRHGVMIELVDINLGTPTSRLAEVSSLVGQLCRGVVARIWPSRDPFGPIRGARFNGISFDAREIRIDEARLMALLRQIALLGRGKAPAIIAQGLPSAGWLRHLHEAGFTHAATASAPPPSVESPAERPDD